MARVLHEGGVPGFRRARSHQAKSSDACIVRVRAALACLVIAHLSGGMAGCGRSDRPRPGMRAAPGMSPAALTTAALGRRLRVEVEEHTSLPKSDPRGPYAVYALRLFEESGASSHRPIARIVFFNDDLMRVESALPQREDALTEVWRQLGWEPVPLVGLQSEGRGGLGWVWEVRAVARAHEDWIRENS